MTHDTRGDRHCPTIELRVRSLAPEGAREEQKAVMARLDELEANGIIDEYVVRVWGKQFCPSTASQTEIGRSIHTRLVELDEWAARTGLSIAPFFDVRSRRSGVSSTIRATVVHPVMALAEYTGSKLEHVTPCSNGRTTYSVGTHLAALEESDDRVPDDPSSRPVQVPALMPAIRDAVREASSTGSEATRPDLGDVHTY